MNYALASFDNKMIFRIDGKLYLESVSVEDTSAIFNPTKKFEVTEEFLSQKLSEIKSENENFVWERPTFDSWQDSQDYQFYRHF